MTTIYHNPRCSKSRQTLELLKTNQIEVDVVEYLKQPPNAATLNRILIALDMEPRDLMRKGETIYKELGIATLNADRAALIALMIDKPILIERPIVVHNHKAAIGRPPENVLELFK